MRRVILCILLVFLLSSCLPQDQYVTSYAVADESIADSEEVDEPIIKEIVEEETTEIKETDKPEVIEEEIEEEVIEIEETEEVDDITKQYLYVLPDKHDEIIVIDPTKKGILKKIKIGTNPTDFLIDGRYAYVALNSLDKIAVINLKDDEVITEFDTGQTPRSLAMNEDYLFSTAYPNYVQIWNKSDFSLVKRIDVGEEPIDLLINGNKLYVANADDDSISVVTLHNLKLTKTILVEDYPIDIDIVGKYLYVINQRSDSLLKIDTTKDEIVKDFKLRFGARPVELRVDGRLIYISNEGSGYIGIHNDATNRFQGEHKVGRSIVSVVPYLDDYLFVADKDANNIDVIKKNNFELVNRYKLNKNPYKIFLVEK